MNSNLWERFRSGEEVAFKLIYDQNVTTLYSYGLKIVQDEDLVLESIQSLFLYIFEKREKISEPDSITAYLLASLKHLIYKQLKSLDRFETLNVDNISGAHHFDMEVDIEEALIKTEYEEERLVALQDAINGLSPQQREVIYLRYYKNLSVDEVAEIMNITNQTVRNVAHNAISKMRKNEMLSKVFLLSVFYSLRDLSI